MHVTANMENFFLEDDPLHAREKLYKDLFGNNDFIGVLVESENVLSRETLELLSRIGTTLKNQVPLAEEALSLSALNTSFLNVPELIFEDDKLVSTDDELSAFQDACIDNDALVGSLISDDLTQAWVLVPLAPYPDKEDWVDGEDPSFLMGEVAWNALQTIETGEDRFTATGVPIYAYRKQAEMMEDLVLVLAVGAIAAILLTLLIIRSTGGVLGTLMVIAFSVIIVFGIFGWFGGTTDSTFLTVPILLTAGVSIGYTVHISRFFTIHFRKTGNRKESVIYAVSQSGKPILFTAFTTIVALISFIFVEIKPIQWVGLISAASVFTVFILSTTIYPIMLSFGKNRKPVSENKRIDRFEKILLVFSVFVGRRGKWISIVFVAIILLFTLGLFRLKIDFNAEKMMGTKLPHMQDQIYIGESSIASSDAMNLVLTFSEDQLNQPEVLQKIRLLEEKIKQLPLIKKTTSLTDTVIDFEGAAIRRGLAPGSIPDTTSRLRALYNLFERVSGEYLHTWVDQDYRHTRIFIEMNDFSSRIIEQNLKQIEIWFHEIFTEDETFFFSGSSYQMALMNQYITRGLVQSTVTALILITLLMMIVFRSIRLGLVAMVPNVFPVLTAGAIMGLFKIPLEFVTMTIAPMIMGLAVDDTIHLISHLRDKMMSGVPYEKALRNSFVMVGTAISETTLILCVTFLVLTFSKVNSIIYVGILSSAGMLSAYLADLFVTPQLIKLLKIDRIGAVKQKGKA